MKIVDLREVTAIDEILNEFVQNAEAQLGSNVGPSVNPLSKAVEEKRVEGGAIFCREELAGIVVYTHHDSSGRINFIHILTSYQNTDSFKQLIGYAFNQLQKKGVTRIVSEALFLTDVKVKEIFGKLGFHALERMIMSCLVPETMTLKGIPSGYEMHSWDDAYLDKVSDVLYDANQGGTDLLIYPELRTPEGTRLMVEKLRRGAAGPFDEHTSMVAVHKDEVCGAVLCARPASDEGFIAEMGIARSHQGKGVGRALLKMCLSSAHKEGIEKINLGVTKENRAAVALYRSLRFEVIQQLSAFVWDQEIGTPPQD